MRRANVSKLLVSSIGTAIRRIWVIKGLDISNPAESLGPKLTTPKSLWVELLLCFERSDDEDENVLKKKSSIW